MHGLRIQLNRPRIAGQQLSLWPRTTSLTAVSRYSFVFQCPLIRCSTESLPGSSWPVHHGRRFLLYITAGGVCGSNFGSSRGRHTDVRYDTLCPVSVSDTFRHVVGSLPLTPLLNSNGIALTHRRDRRDAPRGSFCHRHIYHGSEIMAIVPQEPLLLLSPYQTIDLIVQGGGTQQQ